MGRGIGSGWEERRGEEGEGEERGGGGSYLNNRRAHTTEGSGWTLEKMRHFLSEEPRPSGGTQWRGSH